MDERRRAWAALALTCVVSFLSTLDLSIVLLAFAEIQATFDVSTAQLSWILTAYTIVAAAMLVPSGRLADRIGPRSTFLAGIGMFATGSLLAGLAPTAWFLVCARVVQALGSALQAPASLAIISQHFTTRRATAVGIWGATSGLGSALGPSVGAFITGTIGWRWIFLFNVPLAVAVLVAGSRWLRPTPGRDRAQQPDLVGSLYIVLGVAAVAQGLVQSSEWGRADWRTVSVVLGGGVILVGLLRRCGRQPSPVIDLSLFSIPSYRHANVIAFIFPLAFFTQFFGLVDYFRTVWEDDAIAAGLRMTPMAAIAAAVTFVAGRVADRFGHRAAMVPGTLVYAAGGAWLLVFLEPDADAWVAWAPAAVMLGAGVGLTYASFNSAALHALPPDRYGAGGAMNLTINRVGGTMGVAIAVALLGPAPTPSSYQALWWLLVVCGVLSAVWSARLDTRRPAAVGSP